MHTLEKSCTGTPETRPNHEDQPLEQYWKKVLTDIEYSGLQRRPNFVSDLLVSRQKDGRIVELWYVIYVGTKNTIVCYTLIQRI